MREMRYKLETTKVGRIVFLSLQSNLKRYMEGGIGRVREYRKKEEGEKKEKEEVKWISLYWRFGVK